MIIAAETPEILETAKKAVKVQYKPLQAVFHPKKQWLKTLRQYTWTRNLLAYEHLVRGNADDIISKSKHKVTYHYSAPFTEHAFMEPECAVQHFPKTTDT